MAWYDVRERENNPLKDVQHNNEFVIAEDYIEKSRTFIEKEYPLIIFTEPRYEKTFWKIRPQHLHNITRVIVKDYEDLYDYKTQFPRFTENFQRNPVQNLHKEKFTALYNFVVNQKVEFIHESITWNPFNTERFGWMDLRLYDMPITEIDDIFAHFPEDRVVITQQWYTEPDQVKDRYNWFKATRGKVCAGFFAGYKESLIKFCELCRKEFKNAIDIGTAPTDEMIYSVVVSENLHLFEPHVGDYPDVLHNVVYNRHNAYYTMNYFNWAFNKGHHYYTHRIAENLRGAYYHNTIGYGCVDLHKVWYYNFVACLSLDKRDYCVKLLEEYYGILEEKEEQRNYVKGLWSEFKNNIVYLEDAEIMRKYDAMFS
jgi:hypothetical protein